MNRSRFLAFVGAAVSLLATAMCWAPAPPHSSAAPADYPDVPWSLAGTPDGDIYVSFATDTTAVVRRFGADGVVLARWEVAGGRSYYRVAESAEGGVYVALWDVELVRHYSRDGQASAEWPVTGLAGAITTATRDGVAGTEVYVIADSRLQDRQVHRYSPAGDLRSSFPVYSGAHDLTVPSIRLPDGPEVFVAGASAGGVVERYDADGKLIGRWEVDGWIEGMDMDGGTDGLWVGVSRPSRGIRRVQAYGLDGTPGTRCELPAFPVDLTIGQGGDLYILAYEDPDRDMPREVLRYRQDCTLVDTWGLEHLNGLEQLTPTGPTPTASKAATNAPSATETATAVAATATETPTPDMRPGTPTPTTTYTPFDDPYGWPLFLPIAARGGG